MSYDTQILNLESPGPTTLIEFLATCQLIFGIVASFINIYFIRVLSRNVFAAPIYGIIQVVMVINTFIWFFSWILRLQNIFFGIRFLKFVLTIAPVSNTTLFQLDGLGFYLQLIFVAYLSRHCLIEISYGRGSTFWWKVTGLVLVGAISFSVVLHAVFGGAIEIESVGGTLFEVTKREHLEKENLMRFVFAVFSIFTLTGLGMCLIKKTFELPANFQRIIAVRRSKVCWAYSGIHVVCLLCRIAIAVDDEFALLGQLSPASRLLCLGLVSDLASLSLPFVLFAINLQVRKEVLKKWYQTVVTVAPAGH